MLEKSSTILLTEQDLEDYRQGIVSDRLKEEWDISFEELRGIIERGDYKKANE